MRVQASLFSVALSVAAVPKLYFLPLFSLDFFTSSLPPSPQKRLGVVQDALDRANEVMGSSLTQRDVKIHVVRDVAPNKPMLCISFTAPDAGGADKDGSDAGTDKTEPLVRSVGGDAAPAPAAAAGADGGAAEKAACGSSEAVAGGSGTGGADTATAASAVAATGATAVVDAGGREGGGGGVGMEGSDGGACKKRPRTAEAPGDEGS